jgi:hypothetical protein
MNTLERQGNGKLITGVIVFFLIMSVSLYGTLEHSSISQNIEQFLNANEINAANAALNAFK